MGVPKLTRSFYNTVLSQTFTPCGNYLIVGDIYGNISVFHLSKIVNQDSSIPITKEDQHPTRTFVVKKDVQINSLQSTSHFLLVGTVGEILAYTWKDVKTGKNPLCSWAITIPNKMDGFDKPDVNCLGINDEQTMLYSACGNNAYIFNIETRKTVKELQGHKDYIHSLVQVNNRIVSGGEDGLILTWDIRQDQITNKLEPYTRDKIARPNLGPWIGAVDVNEDWLLCGGGPRLSLWHWRSLNISTVFPIEDKGVHVVEIHQDKVFCGGRSKYFYQMSFNGDIVAEIPTSSVTTYSAVHQETPFKALCIGGSSSKIDICNNFMYKSLQLSLD